MPGFKRTVCRSMLLLPALAVFSSPAAAQSVEIFGGYQVTHIDPAFNSNGWNASVTGNLKHFLGFTADFSGAYKNEARVYTYTFGPVLSARLPVVQPFAHALFGGMTITGGGSTTGFAMMVGGGLDIGLRKGIGLRLLQADWMSLRFSGMTDNKNGRVSTGIVLKF